MDHREASAAVAAALTDLEHAFEASVDAIRQHPDNERAYAQATELVEKLQRLLETSGEVRAQAARNIFESEKMSLAGLADRISISKARAAQLVNSAKKTDKRASLVAKETK